MQVVRGMSGAGKALVVLLVAYVVADVLLTPLGGLETRPASDVTPMGFAGLALLFLGLVLAIVSVVLQFRGSRRAGVTAAIAAVLYFPVFVTDLTGLFSKFRPPAAISTLELIQALVAAITIVLALWALTERQRTGPTP